MEAGVITGIVLAIVVCCAVLVSSFIYIYYNCCNKSSNASTKHKESQEQIQVPEAKDDFEPTYHSFRESGLDHVDGQYPPHYQQDELPREPMPLPIEPLPLPIEPIPFTEPQGYQQQQIPSQYYQPSRRESMSRWEPHQNSRAFENSRAFDNSREIHDTVKGYKQYRPSLADITKPKQPYSYNIQQNRGNSGRTPNTVKGYRQYRPSIADINLSASDMERVRQSQNKNRNENPYIKSMTPQQRQGQRNKEELLYYRLTAPPKYKKEESRRTPAWQQNLPRPYHGHQNNHPDPALVAQNYWI